MALIRWEPVREFQALQNEMNRLLGSFASGSGVGAVGSRAWIPPMDLVEVKDEYVLRADLPGVREEDVTIELEGGNVLTISGERQVEHEDKSEGYYRVERSSGKFARSLTLPDGVDASTIRARFDRGVLEVRIPKPEQQKPQRVQIDVGHEPATIEGSANDAATEPREPVAA